MAYKITSTGNWENTLVGTRCINCYEGRLLETKATKENIFDSLLSPDKI